MHFKDGSRALHCGQAVDFESTRFQIHASK